jgi:LacI family transcriptional regulator
MARSLKSGLTKSIALVVPDVTNPYFAAVAKGAESVSRQAGYNVVLCNTDESGAREEEVLNDLIGKVDGIILAPAMEKDEAPLLARRAGVPVVFLDRETEESGLFDTVLVDNIGGSRLAAEHLLGLGHELIAVIHGPLSSTPGRERQEGFLGALEERGITLSEDLLHDGSFREDGGYQAMIRLLARRTPPTAVFIANNVMTMGAIRALREMSVAIPNDLSVLGFDDHAPMFELLSPGVTVIDRPMEEQGVLAMRLLLKRLGPMDNTAPRRIVMDTRLITRGSCAPPREIPRSGTKKTSAASKRATGKAGGDHRPRST